MKDYVLTKIDDGKKDIYIGHPDSGYLLINEQFIKDHGGDYELMSSSRKELAVFLQVVVLKILKTL